VEPNFVVDWRCHNLWHGVEQDRETQCTLASCNHVYEDCRRSGLMDIPPTSQYISTRAAQLA